MNADGRERSIEAVALDLLPDAVVLAEYDREQGVLVVRHVNAAAERRLARPRSQILGRPMREMLASQAPFELRPEREALLEGMRKLGTFEMPAVAMARDASGELRRMRVRFHWPGGSDRVVAIAEDVTDRSAALQHATALDRLRFAREVSGLLSHYLNDALTVALMGIEDARHAVAAGEKVDLAGLAHAVDAVRSASEVLTGLSAATEVDADLLETSDLEQVLREEWEQGGERLRLQTSDLPRFVWGSTAQLRMILGGFRPLLGGEVEARIHGGEQETLLQLRTRTQLDDWLPLLIDPTMPLHAEDRGGRSLRLFASVQVLHAVGGRLGMPSRDETGLRIEVAFRTASRKIDAVPRQKPVLLVSGDGALRAMIRSQLDPRPTFFTDDVREGLAWLMRPRSGAVIYDVDHLHLTPAQLLGLQRMLAPARSKRVILAARVREPDPGITLPQIRIPIERAALLEVVADALA